MSTWFLRISVLYIVLGVALGIYMAASHNHAMHPVHAHYNLLGWVAMSLFGLFYRVFPAAENTKLARAHFWIYAPSVFMQMLLLTLLYLGHTAVEPVLGLFSILVGVGFVCFAIVVWKSTSTAK